MFDNFEKHQANRQEATRAIEISKIIKNEQDAEVEKNLEIFIDLHK